jgi:hypothetical protein
MKVVELKLKVEPVPGSELYRFNFDTSMREERVVVTTHQKNWFSSN